MKRRRDKQRADESVVEHINNEAQLLKDAQKRYRDALYAENAKVIAQAMYKIGDKVMTEDGEIGIVRTIISSLMFSIDNTNNPLRDERDIYLRYKLWATTKDGSQHKRNSLGNYWETDIELLGDGIIGPIEFHTRYVKYIMEKTGMNHADAHMHAEAGHADWDGSDTPEECVDEELSRWGD